MKIEEKEKIEAAILALKSAKPEWCDIANNTQYCYCSLCKITHTSQEAKVGCFPEVANLLKHE